MTQMYNQYKRNNPYEHHPISFKAWKRRFLDNSRVKRTSLRTNDIPSDHAKLNLGPSLDIPTPPTFKAASEAPTPKLPKWYSSVPETRVHFQSRGKLIGSLNFGHLVIDIDLKKFIDGAKSLCGPESRWMRDIEKVKKSARVLFKDLMLQYELQCKQLIFDLEETEAIWLKGEISVPHRKKRQFFMAGMLAGAAIVAISSYLFSNSALIDISTGSSQNPLTIRHLQDHEKRISINERSIAILKEHIANLEAEIKVDHQNIQIINLLMRTQPMMANLVRATDQLIDGLDVLLHNRLSRKLVQNNQILPILQEVKRKLSKLNLIPAISHTSEVYHLECSHMIYKNGTIRAFVHIPAYRKGSLMNLHVYLGSPVHIGDGHFIHPQPFGTFLSSNTGNTLFRTFTPEEFSFCRQVSGTFYCKNTNWYRKRFQDNCLINLFLGDTERIRDHCPFVITKDTEILTQMNHKTFQLFSLKPSVINMQCPGYLTATDQTTFSGAIEIYLQPECSAESGSFEMEGSADVFGASTLVKFHDLDIFSPEDYQSLKDNFPSLPKRSLDLIGSSKGMKFEDITAEFAAQKRDFHIRVGLLAGLAALTLIGFLIFCCCKCVPCAQCCKWLCTRRRPDDNDDDGDDNADREPRHRVRRRVRAEDAENHEMEELNQQPPRDGPSAPPTYTPQATPNVSSRMKKIFEKRNV